jgi:hypothetical protein
MRALLGVLCFGVAACGGDDDPCGEPAYGGGGTDEAWRVMVDGEPRAMAGHAMAPVFTAPAAGAMMPAAGAAPRVAWTSPLARKPHLPPVTDDVYLVRIAVPGRTCPVMLLTTQLEWQLTDAQWGVLRAAPGDMSVSIVSAYLDENRITEGPFAPAAPLVFQVE